MKKRTLIAVVLVLAVILIAQTGAWAGKLQAGSEAPALADSNAGIRPMGTGGNGGTGDSDYQSPPPYVPPAATFVVEEFSGDVPEGAPEGATFQQGLESGGKNTLSKTHKITLEELELASDFAGAISYWNGSEWIELTVVSGKVTVPAGSPNPVVIAIVE